MFKITAFSSTLRRFTLVLFIIMVLYVIFNVTWISNMTKTAMLQEEVTELKAKLKNLRTNYKKIQKDTWMLSRQVCQLSKNSSVIQDLPFSNDTRVELPSIYHLFPNLLNPDSQRPAFISSKGRFNSSIVLGIPTVKRDVQNYMMKTLENLLSNMNPQEAADTIIIVMVAETDLEYVHHVARQIEVQFPDAVEAGTIEVIAPSASYYPDISELPNTLGDREERVHWRSKQTLDFAFLMSYAQTKGTFYVQLEDDVVSTQNFVTTMKSFAAEKAGNVGAWLVLDFCHLGFIGKMFKSDDLPRLVLFFLMFYNEKPVDWLLPNFISTKVCNFNMNKKQCDVAYDKAWLHHKPSLFQHIGTHSSLKGKVQKLKDEEFGKISLFHPHKNPDAILESQITPYKQYTLENAYKGKTFFWAIDPKPGDRLLFKFKEPIFIKKYLFRSGNLEHLFDEFVNTTVEILPASGVNKDDKNVTGDGYIVIGHFNEGVASGTVDKKCGKIAALRLTVHEKSKNWAILSEISIEEDRPS